MWLLGPKLVYSALTIGATTPDHMVAELRKSLFVKTTYLEERQETSCSSLDGPTCAAALLGTGTSWPGTGSTSFGDMGVIPEVLVRDLGNINADMDRFMIDYNTLEYIRQQAQGGSKPEDTVQEVPLPTKVESSVLHFAELLPDSRLPLTFSRGLPQDVVATWDGRWRVSDCSTAHGIGSAPETVGMPLALPPVSSTALTEVAPEGPSMVSKASVSVVAELAENLGYLRFSKPVVVLSLFAHWQPQPGTPPAVIGGRLGLENVWTTHLDPARLQGNRAWLDISGDPFQPVDEVVFVAAKGLEVGALEVVADGGKDEGRMVLMLSPVEGKETRAALSVGAKRLSAAVEPYVMSLEEVIERNLRIRTEPDSVGAGARGGHVPGLVRSVSTFHQEADMTWAVFNEELFQHRGLVPLLGQAANDVKGHRFYDSAPAALAHALSSLGSRLPPDLRKALPREEAEIRKALKGWLAGGKGWRRTTPSTFPQDGSETAVKKFAEAKGWQTKLDLVTAAVLSQRQHYQVAGKADG